jgi:hypothetical protein
LENHLTSVMRTLRMLRTYYNRHTSSHSQPTSYQRFIGHHMTSVDY